MKFIGCAIGLVVAIISGPCSAESLLATAGEIDDLCHGNPEGARLYVRGLTDGVKMANMAANYRPPYCLPMTLASADLRDLACTYLDRHVELHQLSAIEVVTSAFAEGIPCP